MRRAWTSETGAPSKITATGVAVTTGAIPPSYGPPLGQNAVGVLAEAGGQVFLTDGSVTTYGNSAYAVVAHSGGLVQLNGTSISTNGNGSGGLGINGAGSEIDATNVTISTTGGFDSSTGQHSYGVYNGPYMSFTTGGAAKLTDTSVSTQGAQMYGVITSTGGATTLSGGSVSTSGDNANGLYATGAGSSIATSNGTTIATTGANAIGVLADTGGAVTLNGGSVTTKLASSDAIVSAGSGSSVTLNGTTALANGDGAGGLILVGSGASLTATGVNVTTHGNPDVSDAYIAWGAYNGTGAGGSPAGGGLLTLTNSSILTTGTQAGGVFTADGGVTNVSGSSVTTSGQDAHALYVDRRRLAGQSQRLKHVRHPGRRRDRVLRDGRAAASRRPGR